MYDRALSHPLHGLPPCQGVSPPVLIFVQSKERAEQLFSELRLDRLPVDIIHADKSAAQVGGRMHCSGSLPLRGLSVRFLGHSSVAQDSCAISRPFCSGPTIWAQGQEMNQSMY